MWHYFINQEENFIQKPITMLAQWFKCRKYLAYWSESRIS